jgi:hypothetical protein
MISKKNKKKKQFRFWWVVRLTVPNWSKIYYRIVCNGKGGNENG